MGLTLGTVLQSTSTHDNRRICDHTGRYGLDIPSPGIAFRRELHNRFTYLARTGEDHDKNLEIDLAHELITNKNAYLADDTSLENVIKLRVAVSTDKW
jgi:hypothetical protein